jgi:hypothetical protein
MMIHTEDPFCVCCCFKVSWDEYECIKQYLAV